jgi:peptide/nickel transport system permease protein
MRFMSVNLRPSLCLSTLALLVLAVFAVFENLISPYDPLGIEFLPLDPPNLKNLFGTDNLGRDVFSRFVAGARISFVVGLTSVFFSSLLGILAGLAAAYFKKVQAVLMRVMDAIWAFPMLLLAMALAVSLQPGMATVIIAIALVYSPLFARLVYAQALSILEREFILAAQAFGCRPGRLLITHVLPNLAAPVIVQATLTVGTAIVLESSLSFLGVGIQPPTPSWGVMIQSGYKWLEGAPWMSVLPGLGIYVTVVSFSVLGDWLRLILDPKQLTRKV